MKLPKDLPAFCDKQGWRSCFIGGIAVQGWGEPRVTRDVELTLLTRFGGADDFLDSLLAAYQGRARKMPGSLPAAVASLLMSPSGVF